MFSMGEQARPIDLEEERRQRLYREQEALQEPGAMEKFLEEVKGLSGKVAGAEESEYKLIRDRARDIVDINVGVVKNPDLKAQGRLNNEISRLTDEIFKRDSPKTYEMARTALVKGLSEDFDIYDEEAVLKLILADFDPVIFDTLRKGIKKGRWEVVAGIKPVRAAALKALRKPEFGKGKDVKKYGDFEALEERLEEFENNIGVDEEKIRLFRETITNGHDRVRCRVYANSRQSLDDLVGEVKIWTGDWLRGFAGLKSDWNYYMSKWVYESDGTIWNKMPQERTGPPTARFFKNVFMNMKADDLVYAAWHAHLILKMRFGGPLKVEMQIFPKEFAAMHNLLDRIFKQENPDIRAVSPRLRKIAREEAEGVMKWFKKAFPETNVASEIVK